MQEYYQDVTLKDICLFLVQVERYFEFIFRNPNKYYFLFHKSKEGSIPLMTHNKSNTIISLEGISCMKQQLRNNLATESMVLRRQRRSKPKKILWSTFHYSEMRKQVIKNSLHMKLEVVTWFDVPLGYSWKSDLILWTCAEICVYIVI